ncbi:MAG: DUF3551 domain-containing protein [Pseudolabrys sp.]
MTRFRSTLFAAVVLAALAALLRPAAAIEYPWCAQYSGGEDGGGGRNCGFSTYEQCMATVSGIGGTCEPNLFYTGPANRPAKHARKPRKRHYD